MKFSEITQKLGEAGISNSLTANKELDPEITGVAAIDEANSGTISYVEAAKFKIFVGTTSASALILPNDEALQIQALERSIAWVATPNPRLLFAQTISLFYQPWRPLAEIHPTAVIHPTAKIGRDVYIGAHAVIQPEVEIGDGVCIHPNVVIYANCKVGDRTTLHANCTIHEQTQIGADCVINSGSVIGGEGFGFVPTAAGWEKMHQSGYTILEDGVEVGCNCTIDRPAVGETRVGRNTVIDNLVHIAHGCKTGAACAMAAQVGMAGGVKLGSRVILAGQVGIANQVEFGDGAIASANSGVHSDVPPGKTVSGYPAVPHSQFLKVSALLNRLPEMYQTFRKWKRKLGDL